jgi:DNA-directed RNA polymerase specialized sigma24 family protein
MNVADLVRAARNTRSPIRKRQAAFAILVERFQAMALAVALEGSGDAESARDASQGAFLAAWRNLHRLRDADAFGGWLKRLVRTQCARPGARGRNRWRRSLPRSWTRPRASPATRPVGSWGDA